MLPRVGLTVVVLTALAPFHLAAAADTKHPLAALQRPQVLVINNDPVMADGCATFYGLLPARSHLHLQFVNLHNLSRGQEVFDLNNQTTLNTRVFDLFEAVVGIGVFGGAVDKLLSAAQNSGHAAKALGFVHESGAPTPGSPMADYSFIIRCDHKNCAAASSSDRDRLGSNCGLDLHIVYSQCKSRMQEIGRLNLPISGLVHLEHLGHAHIFADALEETCCSCDGECNFSCPKDSGPRLAHELWRSVYRSLHRVPAETILDQRKLLASDLSAISPKQTSVALPLWSTVDGYANHANRYRYQEINKPHEFHVLQHVTCCNDVGEFVIHLPQDRHADVPRLRSTHSLQGSKDFGYTLTAEPFQKNNCDIFVDDDAFIFGNILDYNIGHFLHDAVAMVYFTMTRLAALRGHGFSISKRNVLIRREHVPENQKFSEFFLPFITDGPVFPALLLEDIQWHSDRVKTCFSTLVVGADNFLWLQGLPVLSGSSELSFQDIPDRLRQEDIMRSTYWLQFVEFIIDNANLHSTGVAALDGLPRIVTVTMIMRKRRFLTNVDELLQHMRGWQGLGVDRIELIEAWFERMTVYQQMAAMRQTHGMVAVYGAGILNGCFMPRWATLLLLVPLDGGWDFNFADVLREQNLNVLTMTQHNVVLWQNMASARSFPPHGSRLKETELPLKHYISLFNITIGFVGTKLPQGIGRRFLAIDDMVSDEHEDECWFRDIDMLERVCPGDPGYED